MFKKYLLTGLTAGILGVSSLVYASESTIMLEDSTGNSSFIIINSNGEHIARFSGDGNVIIGGADSSDKLEVKGNVQILGSGNGITFPDGTSMTTGGPAKSEGPEAGTIVQIVTKKLSTNLGPGADNGWSGTLESMTIVPKFANSKILVSLHGSLSVFDGSGNDPHLEAYVRIVAGSEQVADNGVSYNSSKLPRDVPFYMEGEYLPGSVNPVTFGIQLRQRIDTIASIVFNVPDRKNSSLFKAVEVAQ